MSDVYEWYQAKTRGKAWQNRLKYGTHTRRGQREMVGLFSALYKLGEALASLSS